MTIDPEQVLRNRAWHMIRTAKEYRRHNNGLTRWTPAATQREEVIPTYVSIARSSLHAANLVRRGVDIATAIEVGKQGINNPCGIAKVEV